MGWGTEILIAAFKKKRRKEGKRKCGGGKEKRKIFSDLLAREVPWPLPDNFNSAFQVLHGNLLGEKLTLLENYLQECEK